MIVETVSPTPFALLRRAKNFRYREEDYILQQFSDYDDPVTALTDECRRVLKSIATANESTTSKTSTSLQDASWSRFEDIGFSGFSEEFDDADEPDESVLGKKAPQLQGLRTKPATKTTDLGRPTTPSWADFLSSGFIKDAPGGGNPALLLPPDKQLPPINTRSQTSQSHRRGLDDDSMLEPGELASITAFNFDDTFWWVWMTSLAGEETPERKSAFGRCTLVETSFSSDWLVMEEIIKGAEPEPEAGAYIAEKKTFFGFSRRTKVSRSKSSGKRAPVKADALGRSDFLSPASKTSIAPDQHARIQAAAAALQQRNKAQQVEEPTSPRRARHTEEMSLKTNSVLTLQPMIMSEAAQAMKWANSYDKNAIRAKYLGDNFAGRGSNVSLLNGGISTNNASTAQLTGANGTPGQSTSQQPAASKENAPPAPPKKPGSPEPRDETKAYPGTNTALLDVLNKGPPVGPGNGRTRPAQPVSEVPQTREKPVPGTPKAPAVPSKDKNTREELSPAAIPLPGDTPAPSTPTGQQPPPMPEEYPRPMERKPVPTVLGKENQPSQTNNVQNTVERSNANGAAVATSQSPESPKHNKLKKKNPQGGFKGLFGRKKADPPAKAPPPRSVSSSSAVAAAKAALEAKAAQNQKTPEPAGKPNAKRFSVGRKNQPEPVAEPIRRAPTVPEEGERQASVPQQEPFRNQSMADSEEQRAEREFSKFDQGPLEDVPAFVPDESLHEHPEHLEESEEPGQEFDEGTNTENISSAHVSEDDGEELSRSISPSDRWAQIRKNAAERNNAPIRQSEEQSRRTDRTADDGDTSGEESE